MMKTDCIAICSDSRKRPWPDACGSSWSGFAVLDISQIQSFYPEQIRPFRTSILREYLQHKILESLFRSRHGAKLSFMGGPASISSTGAPVFRGIWISTTRISRRMSSGDSPSQYDAVFLMGKARANMAYLSDKLGIEETGDLRGRLLARAADLDLRQLASDVEPFVVRAQDTDRVLLFPEYIAGQL